MLFIASFGLLCTKYMQDKSSPPEPKIRLIKAANIQTAADLLFFTMEKDDPYGTSYSVVNLDISACIQEESEV